MLKICDAKILKCKQKSVQGAVAKKKNGRTKMREDKLRETRL